MMSMFEKRLEDYLTFYKVPLGPNQLDSQLFYFPETGEAPMLHQSILNQISRDVESLVDNQPQRVSKYYLTGPALNPRSKNRSGELKVHILINKNIMDVDVDGLAAEQLLKRTKKLSGKLAIGTTRPITYIISVRDLDLNTNCGVYDLYTNKWIKTPNGLAT